MRRLTLLGVALLCALALSIPGAFARSDASVGTTATPGVTARTISIGGTFPLTGNAALYGTIPRAMGAYFSYVNATRGPDGKRGVRGRQIKWTYYDDGYNPAQSVQLTRRLVQQDRVFAVVGSLGTEVNLAIRPYLNAAKVPHMLVASGAETFSREWRKYPWTTAWFPDYVSEGLIYGRHIAQNSPNAKIGVIYQNDDYGKDLLYGLKVGLGKAKSNIASEQPYEVTSPDPRSQIARLRASGATVFVIILTPRATIQAYAFARALGWNPERIYANSVSGTDTFLTTARSAGAGDLVEGTISIQYAKDPANRAWDNDPGMKLYRTVMSRFFPNGADAQVQANGINYYGVAVAHAFVQQLRKAGANPTRDSIVKVARSWTDTNPFLLPGNPQKTTARSQFPIRGFRMVRYQAGRFTYMTPLIFPRGTK
jgi:branched-chain amino acid transport system substrate-binding protein